MNQIDGKIFISGGGGIEDSLLLDKKFVNSFKKKKVLYIPIAMERDEVGFESCYDWIISALSRHSEDFIDIVMLLDLADKNLQMSDFDGIYIGGGNTYKLLQYIYATGFDKILMSFIKNNGIVYGGSAGAIILGKNISTVIEENDKNYKYDQGLSLIGDYSIRCHYNKNIDDEKIFKFIKYYKYPVIALPEKTGLVINNKYSEVIGSENAVIFNINGEREYKKPNDVITSVHLII